MKIRLIHGIHEKEGENNMSVFAPCLREVLPDADIVLFEYGFVGFWEARWKNDDIAYDLASISKLGKPDGEEVWITHSNGAAVAYLAVREYGARPNMIINFNPALDRWRTAPVERVETVYSEEDRWVHLAQWLPMNLWGDQGRVGYKGRLGNTISHNASQFDMTMAYTDHCGAFTRKNRRAWSQFSANRINLFFGGRK